MTTDAPPRVENPYVGPTSFRLGDPLFGRGREQEDLLDLLVAERIVLLYSPSGAGKTSLIQAALISALGEAGFEVLPIIRVTHALEPRPGMPTPRNRYVLSTLLSLEEGVPADKQTPLAELPTLSLRGYMDAHADRDQRPGNEVLIFDQFEEVLTADPTDEPAKHAFFRELGEMLRDRGHWALFSMREDFLAALDPYVGHLPTRFRSTFRLDLLTVPEALEAMRRPAERAGVDFTEEAAVRLVDDLRRVRVQRPGGGTDDALGSYVEPVQLQVACRLLWSTLPPGATRITPADVEALGDVDQALADYYADRIRTIAERTGVRESAIRDWFEERLITPQGLRGQVLEGPDVPDGVQRALLGELVDAHLVRGESRRQATWYELAHDRLIEPVRRDNAAWRTHHQTPFERAAALWEQEGKSDRLLLLGPDLATAEQDPAVQAGPLKARERDFLDASRRSDEQVRRDARTAVVLRRSARRLWVAVALVTVLAVAAGLFLVQSLGARDRAQEETDRAEAQNDASRLLLWAQRNLAYDQDLATTLAIMGAKMYPTEDLPEHARDVLYRAAASPVSLVLRGQQGPTTTGVLSADASTVVAAGAEDIRTWDRDTGEPGEQLRLQQGDVVNTLDVTADGRTVIAGLKDGTLLVWDVNSSEPLRWDEGTETVWSVLRSPDGERFASVGAGNQVQVWGLDGTLQLTVADPKSAVTNSVAFSPEGDQLASVGDTPEVVVWDAASGMERARLPLPEAAWSVAFGSDADTLATVTPNAVTVWDLASGQPLYPPFQDASESFRSLNWDLSQIMTVETYGQVRIYDTASGNEVASSYVPGAAIWGAAFDSDPDRIFVVGDDVNPAFWDLRASGAYEFVTATAVAGDNIFSAWSDGTVQVWSGEDAQSGGVPVPGIQAESVYELAADAKGLRLAALTDAGQVRLWDTTTGAELLTREPGDDVFSDVDITPDGAQLVTADSAGRVSRWDAVTGVKLADVVEAQGRGVAEVRVSPDGSSVLAMLDAEIVPTPDGDEPVALVAPLSGGNPPLELRLPDEASRPPASGIAPPEFVTAGAFSADGKRVTVGTSEGRVTTLDARTGDLLWPDVPLTHQGEVREVLVAGTGGSILTTGVDSQVVVLDPADGARIRQVPSESEPEAALLTSDGENIVLLTSDAGAVIPLDDSKLLDLVGSTSIYDLTPAECAYYRVVADC